MVFLLRLYIKRRNIGRGLVELESACNVAVVGINEYIWQSNDRIGRIVQGYDAGKPEYSLQKEANLIKPKYMTRESVVQNIKNHLKPSTEKEKTEKLKMKPMHGQIYRQLVRPSVDKAKSLAWLGHSLLKGEMESLTIVTLDQALNKGYHQRNIRKQYVL